MAAPLPAVAILAGGLATRLRPITETIPKSLVPVRGRPFLAHQLELLRRQGFDQIVVCVGHLGGQIEAAFGDGRDHGVNLRYSHDGPQPIGTAGALRQALPLLGETFFVLYGDSYLETDYRAIWNAFQKCAQPALMTVIESSKGSEPANVWFEAEAVRAYGKKNPGTAMRHIDYGLSVYRSEVFQKQCPDIADLSELQSALARQGVLAGHEVTVPYFEIGSPSGLQTLESHLQDRSMNTIRKYLDEVREIASQLDIAAIERLVERLVALRARAGRLFFLGVGGSAANASHAVNDFRKITGIECYAPTDNVSELTARTNDEGWATVFSSWLETSRLSESDALFIFSVGGGDEEKNISPNLIKAVMLAKARGATVLGIVGRKDGYTARVGDAVIIIPTVNPGHVTPHTEAFQAVIWHLLVSHPELKKTQTKWEGVV